MIGMKSAAPIIILFASAACGGADSGMDPIPPPPAAAASLAGIVRNERDALPVSGATVTVGAVTVTAGVSGEFSFPTLSAGAASISVNAAGFNAYNGSLTLAAGSNSAAISLFRPGTLYASDNLALYVPAEVTTIRGVLMTQFGGTVDGRALLRDDIEYYRQFPLAGDVAEYRRRMIAFAGKYGFAIVGMPTLETPRAASIISGITGLSLASGHPELAQAPIVIVGNSNGACMAFDLAARDPRRVIGFIATKALCTTVTGLVAEAARTVPGYFIVADADPQQSAQAAAQVRADFETARATGAPWAFGIQIGAGHEMVDYTLIFDWLGAVVTQRLPEGNVADTPVTLIPVTEDAGWLGDRSSFAIARYPCFTGNQRSASWLPSQETARDWQTMASRSAVTTVTSC